MFIDKPLAGSYKDAKEIAELGKAAGVPWFTASSLRFWSETERLKNPEGIGHVLAFDVLGPTIREPHVPSMFNYGVHAIEMLYQLMGPGCESVSMQASGNQDVVVGKWKDGRLGVMRGFSSGLYAFSITVYGDKGRPALGRRNPRAMARCWWRLPSSSRPASRPSTLANLWRSSHSWKLPT